MMFFLDTNTNVLSAIHTWHDFHKVIIVILQSSLFSSSTSEIILFGLHLLVNSMLNNNVIVSWPLVLSIEDIGLYEETHRNLENTLQITKLAQIKFYRVHLTTGASQNPKC
jgi:hypothetical protein